MLDNSSLFTHIVNLPQLHLPTTSLLLSTEELKFYFTDRFLKNKTYLNMDFTGLCRFFEVHLNGEIVSEYFLKDSLLLLFLNATDKATIYLLNSFKKHPDSKEVIQKTAKEVLTNMYNKNISVSLFDDFDTKNYVQKAIDTIIEEPFLNDLINTNQDQKTTDQMQVLHNGLENDFENALKNKSFIAVYIRNSEKLAKGSKRAKSLSYTCANYTAKLLIKAIKETLYTEAKQLTFSYMTHICPYTGLDEKSEDVASNAIVLSILIKDDSISKLVFEKLLAKNFDIETTSNSILLFNLACYYALKKDKENLLKATTYALKNGKKAKQFTEDKDFESFLTDAEFKALLIGN